MFPKFIMTFKKQKQNRGCRTEKKKKKKGEECVDYLFFLIFS